MADEIVLIDFKKVFKQHKRKFMIAGIVLLILIPMFFSVYYRSFSSSLPITQQWAEDSLANGVRSQVTQAVNQQYPNLPADTKANLINQQVNNVINEQRELFDAQAKQQSELLKQELKKEDGQTYLLAIDPYFYYLQTKNVLDHGYGADIQLADGTKVDLHKLAPIGSVQNVTEFHPYFAAGVYRLVSIFDPDPDLFNIFFWMPVIISALAVIPAFFITRKAGGNLGGFIAAMLVAIHASFIGRTAAGFADTDAYNVTFPLFIFWMFIEAFESKDLKRKLIFSGLFGLLTGIYTRTWAGWWYIFDFALLVMIVYFVYSIIREWARHKDIKKSFKAQETKQAGITIAAILVASGIFITIFKSFSAFIRAPLNPIAFTTLKEAAKIDLWPNVLTTVAELNEASLGSIIGQMGGTFLFYLACMGLVITLVSNSKLKMREWLFLGVSALLYLVMTSQYVIGKTVLFLFFLILPIAIGLWVFRDSKGFDSKYAIFLAIWFVGTIYASTSGIRFVLVVVPAFAVAVGLFVGRAYQIVKQWSIKDLKIPSIVVSVVLVFLTLLLLIQPLQQANVTALNEIPSMNDDWWASLEKINLESEPDAIINSWWDFGHWFKAVGDRAVTFDGASQNTPMAHWVGKVLSTKNEHEAIGILRMLDCGSHTGFDQLTKEIQGTQVLLRITPETTLKAKPIIDELLLIWDKDEARAFLEENGLSTESINRILPLTHCSPPEDYFITSGDMVGKAGVWGHFGGWDFEKAYIYNILRNQPQTKAVNTMVSLFGMTEDEASKTYFDVLTLTNERDANTWISGWPNYLTSGAINCVNDSDTVVCPMNIGVGQNNGQQVVLERAVINLTDYNNTQLILAVYGNGNKLGEEPTTPQSLITGEDTLERFEFDNPGFNFDLVLSQQNNKYQAALASKELASSMFTRLFYFDGAYTEHFEKFSDRVSRISGTRIIVWKVTWPEV